MALTVTDVPAGAPANQPQQDPPGTQLPAGDPNVKADAPAPIFTPIVPPPSPHHPLNTGLGTEMGDSAMTVVEKINKGFANVIAALEGAGVALKSSIEGPAAVDMEGAINQLKDWISKTFVSVSEHQSLADKVSSVQSTATSAMTAANNAAMAASSKADTVAKADFDALKSDLDATKAQFATLADKLETFLGLKKSS